MTLNLRTKLICFSFSIVLLVGGIISLYGIYQEKKEILSIFEREGHDIAALISSIVVEDIYSANINNLRRKLANTRVNPDIRFIYVMDQDGVVLADGSEDSPLLGKTLKDSFNAILLRSTDWVSIEKDRLLKIGGPILMPDRTPVGYLHMGFSLELAYQDIHKETRANLIITAACLGIGAILAFILATRLSRPISAMVHTSREIGRGNLDSRVTINRGDELGVLADGINQMAADLNSSMVTKDYVHGILNSLTESVIVLDPKGTIVTVNPATVSLLGYGESDLIGMPMSSILSSNPGIRVAGDCTLDFNEIYGTTPLNNVEVTLLRKDGSRVAVLFSSSPMLDRDEQPQGIICAARDITERIQTEQALRRSEKQIRHALEEREQLGRDLHDGILQSLYAVGLSLEACKPLVEENPKAAVRDLNQAIGQLGSLMREVRSFIARGELSYLTQEQPFGDALRALVEGMVASHATRFEVTADPAAAAKVTSDQALHLLNIVREAISNTTRHAHAQQGTISVQSVDGFVRLELSDDGNGFNLRDRHGEGHGLRNMEARVGQLGGRLRIDSRPGSGTRIVIDIPQQSAYV